MKKSGLIVLMSLMWLTWACTDTVDAVECSGDQLCTEQLVYITFAPRDAQENLIILDNYYSQNLDNGNTYSFNDQEPAASTEAYVVLTDAQRESVARTGTIIRFFGIRDGEIVLEQDFTIGHDCCHITLIDGPGKVD